MDVDLKGNLFMIICKWYVFIGFFMVVFLIVCGEKEKGIGWYGMFDESIFEYVIVVFL